MINKVMAILRWCIFGMMAIMAFAMFLVNAVFTAVCWAVAGALIMPIEPIRKLRNRINLKRGLTIGVAVVFFFVGAFGVPATPEEPASSVGVTEEPEKSDELNVPSEKEEDEKNETSTGELIPSETPEEGQEDAEQPTLETSPEVPSGGTEEKPVQTGSPVGVGTANPVSLSGIPAYTGNAYVAVQNNQPNFSASELTTVGYETYSALDTFGRCGMAIASCGKEIMPEEGEERGSISSIKPAGWVQAKYSNVSGGYLYNRCHLIGWQLSAENANRSNLITGTRYMNTEGMLPFENMVADYIRETGNHVAYRITPIYSGSDLVCRGVQMEAYSIEDNGEGICFNVFCYNVQPDINIDYATGQSSSALVDEVPPSPSDSGSSSDGGGSSNSGNSSDSGSSSEGSSSSDGGSTSGGNSGDYDGDDTDGTIVYRTPTGKRYHLDPDCGGKNSYSVPFDQATGAGLTPCKKCAC